MCIRDRSDPALLADETVSETQVDCVGSAGDRGGQREVLAETSRHTGQDVVAPDIRRHADPDLRHTDP